MLQIKDLEYRYPGSPQPQLRLQEFSLDQGGHAVLIGPSGSGKSTLLHLLAAMLKPQKGLIKVDSVDLNTLSPRAADTWRGATIGFLPQKLALVPSLSVRENVLLSAYASGHNQDRTRADDLLSRLGLTDKCGAKPHQLSQGQLQRVALARALYNRPRLLIADEPTANLDDAACNTAIALLTRNASDAGASLIVATHDARVLAALPSAKVLHLHAAQTEEAP